MALRIGAAVLIGGASLAEAAPTCCWSKWGDASSCGSYDGHGGQCNTDHSKSCNSDRDCPATPVPPSPPPSPPSPAPPSPPPAPPTPGSEVVGYWAETWGQTAAPSNANFGVAFSGWADPAKAKSESEPLHDRLKGDKWIDAGGGNANGRWSGDWLSKWTSAIEDGSLKEWKGIVFDIEECSETGLADKFASAFTAAKKAGLQVLVTVSHSAPYGCSDSPALMKAFFADSNIDYLSPQLYTSGNEPAPSFEAGNQVTWSDWTGAKARFVPSIGCLAVKNGGYKSTQDFFKKYQLAASGYVVWPTQGCALAEESQRSDEIIV